MHSGDRPRQFTEKASARQAVWDTLRETGAARFPFPPHGRIPNFVGAAAAAERLFTVPALAEARCIKANPDSPQLPVRHMALARGIRVYVPTPRLAGGFHLLDPERISPSALRQAASKSGLERWGIPVGLTELPPMDAVITGCVAATPDGRRCGKGEGYADLEWGILRELGHAPVPVLTTVHEQQLVGAFPSAPHDLPLDWIATPERLIAVSPSRPAPAGIDWKALPESRLAEMPVLEELRRLVLRQ